MKHVQKMDSSQSSPKSYEVFVAGIPGSIDSDFVSSFFNEMGPIKKLELLKIGKASKGNRIPKKFYKLTTDSLKLFSQLIDHPGLLFKGRRIFCQEYKSGGDLTSHSADINARRIVVKQVPLSVEDIELKVTLVNAGGLLETMYEYKSEVDIKTDYAKSFKTYSVTFQESNQVLLLIEEGSLTLASGATILIEKFIYRKKGANESTTKTPTKGDSITPAKKLNKHGTVTATENQKKTIGSFAFSASSQVMPAPYDSSKGPKLEPSPESAINFLGWLSDGYKPTSSKYHVSGKAPTYNHSSALSPQRHFNLRFNFLT